MKANIHYSCYSGKHYPCWDSAICDAINNVPGQKLVLICGAPGAGKTTLADTICMNLSRFVSYEADDFFTSEDGNTYNFDKSKLPDAHAQCRKDCEEALDSNFNCIVSNTSTRTRDIETYKAIAEKHEATFVVIALFEQYPNRHSVPALVVERMREQMELTSAEIAAGICPVDYFYEVV